MGQYHRLVNFTKKEYVNPHEFGNGLKLLEQTGWEFAFSNVTHFLLAKCSGRGGGDFHSDMAGIWGGDRVSLVGDYAEPGDFPFLTEPEFHEMMNDVWPKDEKNSPGVYTNISSDLAGEIEDMLDVKYEGTGWKEIIPRRPKHA